MLSDHEQRSLDAIAALLAFEDPVLATALDQHRIAPERRRRSEPRPGRRPRRLPATAWPPLIMITLCLALLIAPALMGSPERRAPATDTTGTTVTTGSVGAPDASPASAAPVAVRPPSPSADPTTVAHRSPPVTAPLR